MGIGNLIIFSGASGAGKDSVMESFLKDPSIQALNFKKIVTCTDRPPRPGEMDGVQYHFLNSEKLKEMEVKGELVEPVTITGTSGKATPKSEIERLFAGENLVWRIDLSRATEVTQGDFFRRLFPENAQALQEHTMVLLVTAPKEEIQERRKSRDLEKYNPAEYEKRDTQEEPFLQILMNKAVPIENLDGKLDKAVADAVKCVTDFNAKNQAA